MEMSACDFKYRCVCCLNHSDIAKVERIHLPWYNNTSLLNWLCLPTYIRRTHPVKHHFDHEIQGQTQKLIWESLPDTIWPHQHSRLGMGLACLDQGKARKYSYQIEIYRRRVALRFSKSLLRNRSLKLFEWRSVILRNKKKTQSWEGKSGSEFN